VEHVADSEVSPDRSTFNSGATGTQAFYDFLRESGHEVMRWRESTSSLLVLNDPKPSTFVIVGRLQVAYTDREARELMHWVKAGGRLVVIDRRPEDRLLAPESEWEVSADPITYPWSDLDPNSFEQMTSGATPLKPAQPTTMARDVESVMPSRFMGAITFGPRTPEAKPSPEVEDFLDDDEEGAAYERQPTPSPESSEGQKTGRSSAPVVHFGESRGALLIDYPYGNGRIVLLSDP